MGSLKAAVPKWPGSRTAKATCSTSSSRHGFRPAAPPDAESGLRDARIEATIRSESARFTELRGQVHFHWIARRAPGRQSAIEHPRVVALVAKDARQPGAGLLVGAGAVANERLVAAQAGKVIDASGRRPGVGGNLARPLRSLSPKPA